MLNEHIEKEELSVVFNGSFNPLIITPYWLSTKNLIRESEATNADVRIMHQEIVDFSLDWVFIEITQTRATFKCTKSPFFDITRDLILGIFKILRETPIYSYGFNFQSTISLKTQDRFYIIGNKIAPFSNWAEVVEEPRLQRIDILQKAPLNEIDGRITVQVYASEDLSIQFAIVINVNNHFAFDIKTKDRKFTSNHLLDNWELSKTSANNILIQLSINLEL